MGRGGESAQRWGGVPGLRPRWASACASEDACLSVQATGRCPARQEQYSQEGICVVCLTTSQARLRNEIQTSKLTRTREGWEWARVDCRRLGWAAGGRGGPQEARVGPSLCRLHGGLLFSPTLLTRGVAATCRWDTISLPTAAINEPPQTGWFKTTHLPSHSLKSQRAS